MKKLYPAAALIVLLLGAFNAGKLHGKVSKHSYLSPDTTGLPDAYTKRHFLPNDGSMTNDAGSIPGNIVKFDPTTSSYEIVTMSAMIKGHAPATVQKPANGPIYQGQVDSTSNFNGSYVINGLKAEKGKVIDLLIQDDAIYSVPQGLIDTATIRNATKSVSPGDRKNYFYITAATVTILSYKIHAADNVVDKVSKKAGKVTKKLDELSHNDTAKSGVYLKVQPPKSNTKAPGSYNAGDTKMLTDKTIPIEIISVDDLVNQKTVKK